MTPTPNTSDHAAQFQELETLFGHIKDFRMPGRVLHPLSEVLITALVAIASGADTYCDMEEFAAGQLAWLRQHLPLKRGAPSHDTFRYVLTGIKPQAFSEVLQQLTGGSADRRIMIDGKSLRGSESPAKGKGMIHLMRAWICETGLSFNILPCGEKSNELGALPELLDSLELDGALVSIDAMGCHPDTTERIINGGADYLLNLKANQREAFTAVKERFAQFDAFRVDQSQAPSLLKESLEIIHSHGRYTEFHCEVTGIGPEFGDWFKKDWKWMGLQSVVRVTRQSHRGGNRETEELSKAEHYYLCSKMMSPLEFAKEIRRHWLVENACHHTLDVTFNEDHNPTRDRNAAVNLSLLREMAAQALRGLEPKMTVRRLRKRAAHSLEFRERVVDRIFHNLHA